MSRTALAQRFVEHSPAPLKTFVVETHANGDPDGHVRGLAGGSNVESTDDRFLYRVWEDEVEFWVDALDGRFWSFHTWSRTRDAGRYLKERLEGRRDLDWMWLPSAHLRDLWPTGDLRSLLSDFRGDRMLPEDEVGRDVRVQVEGAQSGELLRWIAQKGEYSSSVSFDRVAYRIEDENFGQTEEALHRLGRFVAGGDSFELHQEIVRRVTGRYAHLVNLLEARALRFEGLDEGGFRPTGAPIVVRFREVPDMDRFLSELFSAREPFRLWGSPEPTGSGSFQVDAVDLHVGQTLMFDIGRDWLRVYLPSGACGNTVVRLVANLQHRFDGQVRFDDPELHRALEPTRFVDQGAG